MIHDGARPLVEAGIISRAEEAAGRYGACTAAMPVKDTIKKRTGSSSQKKRWTAAVFGRSRRLRHFPAA